MAVALSDYRQTLRDLLHDAADVLVPIDMKDRYINSALVQRNWITGGYRQIFTAACSTVTDTYTYTNLGSALMIDIISINLIFGQTRRVMEQLPLTRMNTLYRQGVNQPGIPWAYARVGQTVVLNCVASSATFSLETDCTIGSTALVLPTDADPLPIPWTDCVPYYAAYLAKLNARRRMEADAFKDEFMARCAAINGYSVGMLPNAYRGVRP